MSDSNVVFTDRELATVLHGLRTIQCEGRIEGCAAGDCEHFDDAEALTNAEIDDLCERLNFTDERRIVVTVDGGCAYSDDPRVLIVDYDNLKYSVRDEVDVDVLAWLEENDPDNIPPTRAEAFAGTPEAQEAAYPPNLPPIEPWTEEASKKKPGLL